MPSRGAACLSTRASAPASRPLRPWLRWQPGWQALGYSTTSMERASGQHARDLLVVVEEASGVDDEIWDAIESLKYTKLVAIGNPIRADGRFVDLIRQADKDRADRIQRDRAVSAIRIPSTESPHAQLDHSPFGLADRTWLEACYRRYGRDSLWVRSHIDAVIPSLSSDQLIPTAWLDYATAAGRPTLPANHPVHRTRRIAVDLGEGVGRDSTAILVRDDLGILDLNAGNSLCLADAAEEVARLSRIYKSMPPASATTSSASAETSATISPAAGSATPLVTPAADVRKTPRHSPTSAGRRPGDSRPAQPGLAHRRPLPGDPTSSLPHPAAGLVVAPQRRLERIDL